MIRLLAVFAIVFLAGCANIKGIVPADMELTMSNVVITQTNGISEGNRFSHELREAVRQELSRATTGPKRTKLLIEVTDIAYLQEGDPKSANRLVSYGKLIDVVTGDRMGEFPLSITANDVGADPVTGMGRATINAELFTKTAKATAEKIYGASRARKFSELPARHFPEPYRIKVASAKPVNIIDVSAVRNLPDSVIVNEPNEALPEGEIPQIIKAPDLLVQ